MQGVCRGIVETVSALRSVDPEILPVHVDATDLYMTSDPHLEAAAQHRQDLVFLALDLISGRIDERHRLRSWLGEKGCSPSDLLWFQQNAVELPFIGLNLYPMFTQKVLTRTRTGGCRIKMSYAAGDLIESLAAMYWERYHTPLFISETASTGSVRRRRDWLLASVSAVQRSRAAGLPLIGYTWWPLFALVTWAYRQGTRAPSYYLKQMGLWDLDADLRRIPTPLVQIYRDLVRRGADAVGPVLFSSRISTPFPATSGV
jgi:hypothetical protein